MPQDDVEVRHIHALQASSENAYGFLMICLHRSLPSDVDATFLSIMSGLFCRILAVPIFLHVWTNMLAASSGVQDDLSALLRRIWQGFREIVGLPLYLLWRFKSIMCMVERSCSASPGVQDDLSALLRWTWQGYQQMNGQRNRQIDGLLDKLLHRPNRRYQGLDSLVPHAVRHASMAFLSRIPPRYGHPGASPGGCHGIHFSH